MRGILLALLLSVSAGVCAKPQEFRFDATHCQVLFFVSHVGYSYPMGRFPGLSGGFTFDPDDWSASKVDATVDVGSLYMGDAAWEKKMLGDGFFNAKRHAQMHFVGGRVEKTGATTGRIHGELTLLGATRPVVLDFRFNKIGRNSLTLKYAAGFSATATLKRSEFGMRKLLPGIGDEVSVRLEIEGIRTSNRED